MPYELLSNPAREKEPDIMDDDTARPPLTEQPPPRRDVRRYLAIVGLLATLGLLAAACGDKAADPGVASGEGTTTTVAPSGSSATSSGSPTTRGTPASTTTTSGSSTTTGGTSAPAASNSARETQTQALQLSQCMRSHGVPNFPDPGAGGGLLQAIASAGIDTHSPAYQAALQACKQYTVAGNVTPAQRAADNAQGLEISQCMRSHGVPNFPDPTTGPTGAPAIDLRPEHIDPSSPAYQAASQACQRIVPGSK
jgi:hypothetical protein